MAHNPEQAFSKKHLQGDKGKLMLQISKSFKGDSRFQMDQRFLQDVDVEKMPEKFKKTLESDLLQRVKEKTKHIKKQQPSLIVRRFEPGTNTGQQIVRKAEGKRHYVDSVMKAEKKKMERKKAKVEKGVDKLARADRLLQGKKNQPMPAFRMEVKGDRKEAFKAGSFRLFQ